MSATDPVIEGFNTGPDGEHYPFGWLGAQIKIGDIVIVESRDDRDHHEPDSYVVYRPDHKWRKGRLRRETHGWHTLPETLLAVAMLMEGVNANTIAHTVPVLVGGFKAVAKDED